MIVIGLDHRCVHAVVHVAVRHPKVISYRRRHLKHWKPFVNARNEAHGFQTSLQNTIQTYVERHPRSSLDSLQQALFHAHGDR